MKKIKKLLTSLSLSFAGMMSKVFAFGLVETKYGIVDPGMIEDKYGVFDPSIIEDTPEILEPIIGEKVSNIGKIAIPIILFVIGLVVLINRKITTKIKIIIISVLIAIGIVMWYIMNYIAFNY